MQITAKFPGTCASCRCQIRVGEKIEWQKGAASRHVICPAGGTPVTPSAGAKCAGVRCGKPATTSIPDTEGNGRIPFCADCARSMGLRARDGARQRIVHAMTDNGFGPQEPKSVFDAPSKLGPCSGCDSRGECAEWCPGLRAEPAVQS